MYSAYDGVHTFQVPAVVNGLDASQIAISWSASDPSMVKLETDSHDGRSDDHDAQGRQPCRSLPAPGTCAAGSLLTIHGSDRDGIGRTGACATTTAW